MAEQRPSLNLRLRPPRLLLSTFAAAAGLPPHLVLGPRLHETRHLTRERSQPSWRR